MSMNPSPPATKIWCACPTYPAPPTSALRPRKPKAGSGKRSWASSRNISRSEETRVAQVKPFQAVRPSVGKEEKVASLPYDVMNRTEAKEMAGGNPNSFLHVVRAEIDIDESVSQYDDSVYAKGRENLDAMIADGVLVQD